MPRVLRVYADGQIFGDAVGIGTPNVLALHGWRRDRNDFRAVLEGLDAVAIDLPGFGASPVPPEAWGASDYATSVAVVLREMATPAVVIGHSFGGRVAVHLAASHPTRIAGVVLAGVPLLRISEPPVPSLRLSARTPPPCVGCHHRRAAWKRAGRSRARVTTGPQPA